jgi:dihydropyrimidinase
LHSEGVVKGKISWNKFVELTSTNAAKIFGMFPRKGTIAVGSDADIVIYDPTEKQTLSASTHHMNCDYSGYEGWEITGKCKTTILRGKVAIQDGEVRVEKGYGQFIRRGKASSIL